MKYYYDKLRLRFVREMSLLKPSERKCAPSAKILFTLEMNSIIYFKENINDNEECQTYRS